MEQLVNILADRFPPDVPILMEDILGAFPDVARQTLYRRINRALDAGELARFDRGVYYLPRQTRFGQSHLLPEQVVHRKWIERDGEVVGYVSGAGLANAVGITTQVPAVLEVTTNCESTRVRDVPPFGGWKAIRLRRPRTPVTARNVQALRFLDLITEEQLAGMDDRARAALRSLAQRAGRAMIYECAAHYPAKTAKNLVECELNHVFA